MPTEIPTRQLGIVPTTRLACPTVIPAVCLPAAGSQLEVFVNSPDLGVFTAVNNGGSIAVGNINETGAAGPFTEHDNQIELRIGNNAAAAEALTINTLTLTPTAGYGAGAAVFSAPYVFPIAAGGSLDRFINNITDQLLPVAFTLQVSLSDSNDPDDDPFTFDITGTFTGGF